MLRWRLSLGVLLIAALVGLCWLDYHRGRAGDFLFVLAVLVGLLGVGELLTMFRKRGFDPVAWTTYLGTLLVVAFAAAPRLAGASQRGGVSLGQLGWLMIGLALAFLLAIIGELLRFGKLDESMAARSGVPTTDSPRIASPTANLALAAFIIVYLGGLIGFMVQLRLLGLSAESPHAEVGMLALASLVATVKMSDTGQYTAGRLFGRHKLAPRVSPGKTWEGAVGGVLFAVVTAWFIFRWAGPRIAGPDAPVVSYVAIGVFALLLTAAGLIGDLAESMLKRDAGVKDSSTWMPGFGGVLDLLDSLLGAAPVAYAFWTLFIL